MHPLLLVRKLRQGVVINSRLWAKWNLRVRIMAREIWFVSCNSSTIWFLKISSNGQQKWWLPDLAEEPKSFSRLFPSSAFVMTSGLCLSPVLGPFKSLGPPDVCSALQHRQKKTYGWLHSTSIVFSAYGAGLSSLCTASPLREGSECIHQLLKPWSSTRSTLWC